MNESLKFKHINENGMKLLTPLLGNQIFLRYVKYLNDSPLDTPISSKLYENLLDKRAVDGNIVLNGFDESVLKEAKVKIFFHPYESRSFTRVLHSDIYIMDIVVPNKFWVLEGKGTWRAYAIAHEVSKEIDNKDIAGLGKCEITGYKQSRIGSSYTGLRLMIKVDNASISS